MRSREAQPTELEHPFVKRFATVDGMLPFYGCLVRISSSLQGGVLAMQSLVIFQNVLGGQRRAQYTIDDVIGQFPPSRLS
jgi:hypothetical protein